MPQRGLLAEGQDGLVKLLQLRTLGEARGKLLRVMSIPTRFSKARKELYKKRTEIERYFSGGKRSRLLDSHQHLKKEGIELHTEVSMLVSSLTHLRADDYKHMKRMTIKLS